MKEWYSAGELAPLFGITIQAVNQKARTDWRTRPMWHATRNPQGVWRRAEEGNGYLYHYAVLPAAVKVRLLTADGAPARESDDRVAAKRTLSAEVAWDLYARAPDKKKDVAKARLAILQEVDGLYVGGMPKNVAVTTVCGLRGISNSTYYGWEKRVHGISRSDWLPMLMDYRTGRRRDPGIMPVEAWEAYKALYLTNDERTHAECYNRLKDAAKAQGWTLPSAKTFVRRVETDIDPRVIILEREGMDEYLRKFPAQRRDKTVFHALEAVNYDGHKLDVFTLWPQEEKPGRTFLMGFQDIYSGFLLSWRLDLAETAYGFRLAFGDVIENYGIPDHVWSDNTMAAAAKENTGGSRFRNRFKIKEDDPVGLFKLMDCEIHFSTPGRGQSKPIERAWGTLSRYISKSPECAGAYTGNSPVNKPANYGSKAITLAELVKVVEREVHRFNHDPALNSAGNGRSRAEVFAESYAKSPIRVATGLPMEKRRLWLLASEAVTCRKPDGAVWLHENRYWHEALVGMIGRKVVLRFDPDKLHDPVHVYRLDGAFVCTADCVQDSGFNSAAAAKDKAEKVAKWRKAGRTLAALEKTMTMEQVMALMPSLDEAPKPEAKVVRPLFGQQGNAALKAAPDPDAMTDDEFRQAFTAGIHILRPVPVE
ncbi:transposase domain-containing protein [Nitrospirillum amazonense]|uniref:transposase domain-containing protein n=1 Tax=Nitrospirillum amazonense TaxID=28077 RepID=UPI0024124287|nr:transposase domain-containing protein [Nitrospirillum amazonense]MDG3444689.1 transposase domain-containing protein [Nitrospirillum amazonense]